MKKNKLKLEELKVQSFVTAMDDDRNNTIKGQLGIQHADQAIKIGVSGGGGVGVHAAAGACMISDGDVHCPSEVHICHTDDCTVGTCPSLGWICSAALPGPCKC
ncbi:MAG: pinensin family lanthipeptide [Bacteroidota bacterium]